MVCFPVPSLFPCYLYQVALLDETSNILTVSLRGLKSNVKYAEDYVKLAVAQSANTFPTAQVR